MDIFPNLEQLSDSEFTALYKEFQELVKLSQYRYRRYQKEAKRRGLVFELSPRVAAILFTDPCAYCGHTPANGIDRINSKRGYILENCVSCCHRCNTMKMEHSYTDFMAHIMRIHRYATNDIIQPQPETTQNSHLQR